MAALTKLLEAYAGFSAPKMIATAVTAVALAGGVPMSLLAWSAVRTSHSTESTQDSVADLKSAISSMADDVKAVRADVGRVNERTAGLEARLASLESQRSSFVSAEEFRAERRRLDERITDLRESLPGARRRARTEAEKDDAR